MKILTHKNCLPSAKLLRDCMVSLMEERIPVTTRPHRVTGKQKFIRYGCSAETAGGIDLGLNQPELISILSDKKLFSNILLENNFYAPEFNTVKPDFRKTSLFPVVIRTTLNSFKGKGIKVAENKDIFKTIWKSGFHWTPFISMRYELRVHIFNGLVLRVFRKSWRKDTKEDKYPIRTNEGYTYVIQDISGDRYQKLSLLVRNLHKNIFKKKYDNYYFSLDVGWDNNKKEYFILEGNSGPGLNGLTARKYAEYIVTEIN